MGERNSAKLPQVGDVLAAKYRIEQHIGSGGFAQVYRATDVAAERGVAVKVLTPDQERGYRTRQTARFAREAKLVGRLQDPHTVRMFDYGETHDGLFFMVFELLSGDDLRTLIVQRQRLSPAEVEHILRQVLSALSEAHALKLLHRDIKPANIRVYEFLDDPMHAKLMDFGVAVDVGPDNVRLTKTGELIGTLRYMAPEQLYGGDLSPATDLFALGLTMAEALGVSAHKARQDPAVIMQGGPEPLVTVLHRMAQPVDRDRPQSVDDVLAALDGRAEPRTPRRAKKTAVSPPATSRADSTTSTAFPRQWLWLGAVCVLLLLGVSAYVFAREEAQPTQTRGLTRGIVAMPDAPSPRREPEPSSIAPAVEDVAIQADADCPLPLGIAQSRKLTRGGRTWRYFIPSTLKPRQAVPLAVVFHTDTDTARLMFKRTNLREFAEKRGVVLLMPNGDNFLSALVWKSSMQLPEIEDVIAEVKAEACIDEQRIWLIGHGSGGIMAETLSCEPWARALATTSHRTDWGKFPCKSPPIAAMHFHPTLSKHVPREGGATCNGTRRVMPLKKHRQRWADRNNCDGRSKFTQAGATCWRWENCDAPTVACDIEAGHGWAGMSVRTWEALKPCDGPNAEYPYAEEMWNFFSSLPPR